LNQKTRVVNDFTKSDIKQYAWEGKNAILALRNSRNSGVSATAEDTLLPAAGRQGYTNETIPMRFWAGRIELTAQVIKASRSDKGSFARAMDAEQSGLVEDIARQRNRALFGAGTGTLALASAAGNNTDVLEVDTPGGVAGTTNGTRFLKAGMVLAIYKADGSAISLLRTISSVTDHDTIVLDSAGTWEDDAIITIGRSDGTTDLGSRNIEPVGLLGIVDTTTYLTTIHGIDRSAAATAFFKSTVLSSVGAISPDILQRGTDAAEEVSGELIDCYYAHSSTRREYSKLVEADRRYTIDKMRPDAGTYAGGFKADFNFNGVPIKVEKDCPYGILFGVNKSRLFWIPEVEGEWADEDGRILLRASNKDNYEARFRVYENFLSDKGNAHVRFDGITSTVLSGVYAD
jgi:hypothetical protein